MDQLGREFFFWGGGRVAMSFLAYHKPIGASMATFIFFMNKLGLKQIGLTKYMLPTALGFRNGHLGRLFWPTALVQPFPANDFVC